MKFELQREGYNPEQVEEYVSRLKRAYEEVVLEQKALLDSVRKENASLTEKVSLQEAEKERLAVAIKNAIKKTDELNELMARRVAKEVRSIRSFKEKWSDYLSKLMEKYPLDEEVERASEIDGLINDMFDDAIGGAAKAEEFDYNEAVHPTESLSELLSSFGIEGNGDGDGE